VIDLNEKKFETMDEAYDVKLLINALKDEGIELLIEQLSEALDLVQAWYAKSAKLSSNPLDDMGVSISALGIKRLQDRLKGLKD